MSDADWAHSPAVIAAEGLLATMETLAAAAVEGALREHLQRLGADFVRRHERAARLFWTLDERGIGQHEYWAALATQQLRMARRELSPRAFFAGEPAPPTPDRTAPRILVPVDRDETPLAVGLDGLRQLQQWGGAVRLPDPAADEAVRAALLQLWEDGVVSALIGAATFAEHRARRGGETRALQFSEKSRALERLVRDLISFDARRDGLTARLARGEEDFLEATDLRVRLPGLERVRGARVQVTWARTPEMLDRKRSKAPSRWRELVVVSPWTLACGVQPTHPLWKALGVAGFDYVQLAHQIARGFDAAIRAPLTDPRGPAVHVDPVLRTWVRGYVRQEALATTEIVRASPRPRRRRAGTSLVPAAVILAGLGASPADGTRPV
jgi:hypothetical protein